MAMQFPEWPTALTEKMKTLLDEGMSCSQIAKALGLTRGQILGKLRRLGLKTKNPPPNERPKTWLNTAERMTELNSQGLSNSQIANALGLTRGQAVYRIKRLGLKPNPTPKWPAELIEKMKELACQGLSHGQIAKTLGLTRGQVLGKMHHLGLKTKYARSRGGPAKVTPLEKAA